MFTCTLLLTTEYLSHKRLPGNIIFQYDYHPQKDAPHHHHDPTLVLRNCDKTLIHFWLLCHASFLFRCQGDLLSAPKQLLNTTHSSPELTWLTLVSTPCTPTTTLSAKLWGWSHNIKTACVCLCVREDYFILNGGISFTLTLIFVNTFTFVGLYLPSEGDGCATTLISDVKQNCCERAEGGKGSGRGRSD